MAIGQDFYGDQPEQNIANLSQAQSAQALNYGDRAAAYADPFMAQRGQYQTQLSRLMANPGEFSSSPAYQFAYTQGLDAINRKGGVRSGAKLAQLMQYGQGMAGQQYGNQAKLLSDLAVGGSSPSAAGIAYSSGTNRSQDYAQLAAAAKAAGQNKGANPANSATPATPPVNSTQSQLDSMRPGTTPYLPGSSTRGPDNYQFEPTPGGGTGYVQSQYGTYDFGSPRNGDSLYTPAPAGGYPQYANSSYDPYGGFGDYAQSYPDYGGEY